MKKYKVIANPAAGRGTAKTADKKIASLLKARDMCFDMEFTNGPMDAARIASKAIKEFDVVVAVGGDGTVNEIVPAMLFSGKPLGIIPAGSGNDFIKSLHIPADMEKAVDIILRGTTKTIDAGRINDKYFINGVGFGFDAAVNQASYAINHSKRGLYLYLIALFKTLGKYSPVELNISVNGNTEELKAFLVAVGNGTTCGGGFRLTPFAKLNDQLFDITVIKPIRLLPLFWHFPKVFLGTIHKAEKYVHMQRARQITLTSNFPVPVHVDGEIYDSSKRIFTIEIVPHALEVIFNK